MGTSAVPDSVPGDRLVAFGNQLTDVHIRLREELAGLQDDVDGHLAGGGERPRELRAHCLAFCSALTRHHTAEDDGVFPALARQFPELAPVLEQLARDHHMVTAVLGRLQDLLDGISPVPDAAEARRVRGELGGLVALVESHFTYEEKKLVAALNALHTPLPDDFTLRDTRRR
ncbi:hemerythrin domain-containing protein [Streptomyces sp. PSRA5]|uniref:hemerythrin domain-containing protein n=1 Tax=Streptomyces panacea TaxID=3035064 RepID=UPI00339CD5A7